MNNYFNIQCDHYDSEKHIGELPVRVFNNIILHRLENIRLDYEGLLKDQIDYCGLKTDIQYYTKREKIEVSASITLNKLTNERHIQLYENFNQYLWCICYSLFVLFDKYNNYDSNDEYVIKAVSVFNSGFSLLEAYEPSQFFMLPNPEKYNKDDKAYIEKINEIYVDAMTFIMLHELVHHYYGHLDKDDPTNEEYKKDEYQADREAINWMSHKFFSEAGNSFKFGIIACIGSFIIQSNSLSGNSCYPDNDERLKTAMNQLDLSENDNLWVVGYMIFKLWAIKYDIEINMPSVVANCKELFELILEQIKDN